MQHPPFCLYVVCLLLEDFPDYLRYHSSFLWYSDLNLTFIHLPATAIHPSTQLFSHPSHPSLQSSILSSIHPLTLTSTPPPFHTHLLTYPLIHPSIFPLIYCSFLPSIHLSILPSIHPPIYLPTQLFTRVPTHSPSLLPPTIYPR